MKACGKCKLIVTELKCPKCGSEELVENFKGKVQIINPEQSEIANNLKIKEKGSYAIKIR
ncbi:MAG: transcription elongation factor subunit Spt4 [Nanoarchaeota archaeon]